MSHPLHPPDVEQPEFANCAVDGCEGSVSCPPHRNADGAGICRRCAVVAADGRCAYCKRRLAKSGYGAYTLDGWNESDFQGPYCGKPLCMLCWTGLGYRQPGYTAEDASEHGAASDRGPVHGWTLGD